MRHCPTYAVNTWTLLTQHPALFTSSTYQRMMLLLKATRMWIMLRSIMPPGLPQPNRTLSLHLPSIKTFLLRILTGLWRLEYPLKSERFQIVGLSPSRLKRRAAVPRQLQCLYSQWRVGETDCAGCYPRRLKWISTLACRLCGH